MMFLKRNNSNETNDHESATQHSTLAAE